MIAVAAPPPLSPLSARLLERLHQVMGKADRAAATFRVRLRQHDQVIDELADYMRRMDEAEDVDGRR